MNGYLVSGWRDFSHDPRRHPELRASDRDRDIARALLTDGYADGRLTPADHADRSEALWRADTLGELVPLLRDLLPMRDLPAPPISPASPAAASPAPVSPAAAPPSRGLRLQMLAFVVPAVVCVSLWAWAPPHLFWPAWVIVYTGIPPLRTVLRRARHRT